MEIVGGILVFIVGLGIAYNVIRYSVRTGVREALEDLQSSDDDGRIEEMGRDTPT